jgi:CRP/FNR family cyclic AMP-dependent transcriptional regulator
MRHSLQSLPLFSGLGTSALQLLDQHARDNTVPADHLVLREGDPGKHVFLVDRGTVRIWKTGSSGVRELARLGEGSVFGEMGLLQREGRSANAQTLGETRLVILPYVAFEILSDRHPLDYARLLENLARTLVERLRALDDRFMTTT